MAQAHSEPVDSHEKNEKSSQKETKVIKLTAQIEELTAYEKFITKLYHHSILNFIGYAAAGAVLWFLMQGQFAVIWPANADIPSNELRVKDLWNVAMYVVPFLFGGMATKHVSIMIITTLDTCFSAFKLSRLKKKIGHQPQ